VLELQGAAGTPLAVDGCPLALPDPPPLRVSVEPGRHELRAKIGESIAAESFSVGAETTKLAVDKLPVATASGNASAKEVEAALKRVLEQVTAGVPPTGTDSLKLAFLNPAVAAVLQIDAREVAEAPATRAALPDDLALALDALRAAANRFAAAEKPCTERLEQLTTTALQLRQPQAPAAIHRAATLLAALRLGDDAGRSEGAIRGQLGVEESPMLNATVDQVVSDGTLKACAAGLEAPAATLADLTEHCLSQLGGPLAVIEQGGGERQEPESSAGSAQ
jgi:hypothetical protein